MATEKNEEPGKIMLATIDALKSDERPLYNIATETGLSFYWLRKFRAGDIPNPSVNRVEKLAQFLNVTF